MPPRVESSHLRVGLAPIRTTLDNGAVVLAKSTSTTPAVAISLAMRAGSAMDPDDAPGTTWLLSRLIDRGTTSRPAAVIAEELDSRGISLTVTVTRHSFTIVCTCLSEDFEPVTPVAEVGLLRVARRRVPREPCRDDEVRAGAEEFQAGLVADLDAPAGEQRDAAAQVRELRPGGEIHLGAPGAELIVEVVDARVGLLADVADAGAGSAFGVRRSRVVVRSARAVRRSRAFVSRWGLVVDVVRLEALRRKHVGGRDDRPPAQRPDSRLVQHRFSPPDARCFIGFLPFSFRAWIRFREPGDRPMEPPPILGREPIEQPPVVRDPLQ